MNLYRLKFHRSGRTPIKARILTPEQRAFVTEFKAMLDGMEVIEDFPVDNVIPFPKRGG